MSYQHQEQLGPIVVFTPTSLHLIEKLCIKPQANSLTCRYTHNINTHKMHPLGAPKLSPLFLINLHVLLPISPFLIHLKITVGPTQEQLVRFLLKAPENLAWNSKNAQMISKFFLFLLFGPFLCPHMEVKQSCSGQDQQQKCILNTHKNQQQIKCTLHLEYFHHFTLPSDSDI